MARPTWDKYFLDIATVVARRTSCLRHTVGAVIVRDNRILTTGYNGAPSGMKDCLQLGCLRDELGIESGKNIEICRALHAEQNAIILAGHHGVILKGGTIYTTHFPCILCTKMIINSGIKRVVSIERYADAVSYSLLEEVGITYEVVGNVSRSSTS